MDTRTKYVFEAEVISVEERFQEINHRKEGDQHLFDKVSIGWYVRITDSSAVYFGMEEPNFKKGDTVIWTVEKKRK